DNENPRRRTPGVAGRPAHRETRAGHRGVDFPHVPSYGCDILSPLSPGRRPGRPRDEPGDRIMARPVTLFTGQWADLSLEVICQKASQWGYDGIELPCWGDHFNVQKALKEDGYCQGRRDLL